MADASHSGRAANSAADRAARSWGALWASLALSVAFLALSLSGQAQVNVSGRGKNFVAPVTDAQGRKSVLRGRDVKRAGEGIVEILGMQAETYRGREKDMIVEAGQCLFDTKSNVASSPGALSIRTADGRFSIEGEAFRWQLGDSRLNSKLVISNRVHSLVRKRFVASKTAANPIGGRALTSTNSPNPAAASNGEFIDITSDAFDYQGDVALFRGNVRVHETEGDLSCGILRVMFKGADGSLERIEAENEVVLTQAGTRAMSDRAVYTVGEGKEVVEFFGHALWEDGQRQGSGEHLIFDRRNGVLRSEEKAYVKLPRALIGGADFLSAIPTQPPVDTPQRPPGQASVEVFADLITIQLPATNGPVQRVVAERNVLIVDEGQQGRALADRAVYEEATGVLELTGSPVMETARRLVNGKTLRFDRNTRIFTAGPDAYVKIPFQNVMNLGILPAEPGSQISATSTNQFIEIWAREFQYQTNLLRFSGGVRANFLESDVSQGKLTCDLLTVRYAGELESMAAEGKVELEEFAVAGAPRPVSRKVQCERLTAQFNPQGRIKIATAEGGVLAEQEERTAGKPVFTRLTSDSLTALFSGKTNRADLIVADKHVVFAQDQRVARSQSAVYTAATGLVELTGEPTASMPEGEITDAERLIWDPARGRFSGKGMFKSEWKRPPGGANPLSTTPTARGR